MWSLGRLTPHRRSALRLGGGPAGRQLRDRARYRFVRHEGDGIAVVCDIKRSALEQRVAGLPVVYLYPDTAPPEAETEGQAGEPLWELGSEAERAAVIAHAAKPGHRGDPGAGQRGQVNTVAGVVMEVAQIQESCFAEVVVGQLKVSDFGGDYRLNERRQRGVANRQGLVVLEVARLSLRRECVPSQV